jgi:hypothetical protein
MVDMRTFLKVKEKYGFHASWAIWGDFGSRPKDNMDDLSIFEEEKIYPNLGIMHTHFVLVGLNISTASITKKLSNFHGRNGEIYKVRYALHQTPLWGAYMTDILKDFSEAKSEKIPPFLKTDKGTALLGKNLEEFDSELALISARHATLVAFGDIVHNILVENYSRTINIIKIPHYGWQVNKEVYRERVHAILNENEITPLSAERSGGAVSDKMQEDKFTWKEGDLILVEKGEGPTLQELLDEDQRNNPEDRFASS